jgi:hypothetical protein
LSLFSKYPNGKERAALYSGLYRILCYVLPAESNVVIYLVKIYTISMQWYAKERLEIDVPAPEFSQPILA